MAASYPTSIYSQTDVVCSDTRLPKDVSNAHKDEIIALQTKVGADSSAVTATHDYKLSGVTGSDKSASLAGSEILTNKVLTAPTINNPEINEAAAMTATSSELNLLDGKSLSGSDTTIITGTAGTNGNFTQFNGDGDLVGTSITVTSLSTLLTGWVSYTDVVPTRASADDPTYVMTFASVDLTDRISVGMRVSWIQNSTRRYGIVTAIAFSTNTTLTVFGGDNYDVEDTASFAISGFQYSTQKTPYGFPTDPDDWDLETLYTSSTSEATPTQNQWYNIGSISLDIHIGAWQWEYYVIVNFDNNAAAFIDTFVTLSTANNSESDATNTTAALHRASTTDRDMKATLTKSGFLTLAAKDTYYLNEKTAQSGMDSIGVRGTDGDVIVRAKLMYL